MPYNCQTEYAAGTACSVPIDPLFPCIPQIAFMQSQSEQATSPHSPAQPVELKGDSVFQFDCFKGISCFNACCRNTDIALTPYDIVRLKRRLGLDSKEFVARCTTVYPMDHHDLPGLKLNSKPGTAECVFLTDDGCGVYADRPAACRYYALGNGGVRKKDASGVEDFYFLVKESHCRGHEQARAQTVDQYRAEQGIDLYDRMNREWRDIIIKKRSAGPAIGRPSSRSLQLFDMCSYDIDSFREFIDTPGFTELFDIGEDERQRLIADEDELLVFAMRFLKQVLFGVMTIALHPCAQQRRRERKMRNAKSAAGGADSTGQPDAPDHV